jgi:hypothetical protein
MSLINDRRIKFKFLSRPPVALTLTFLVSLAVLYYRRPGFFLSPQLYAEDGLLLFKEAVTIGAPALFRRYADYLVLYQRLIAAAAVSLPYEMAPRAYSWGSILALLLVYLILFNPRIKLPHKPLLALALVLVPMRFEPMIGLINSQWLLAIALLLLPASNYQPGQRIALVNDICITILAGLSGPYSLLFAPLYGVVAAFRRSRRDSLLFVILVFCAIVQTWNGLTPRTTGAETKLIETLYFIPFLFGQIFFGPNWIIAHGDFLLQAVFALGFLALCCFLTLSAIKERQYYIPLLISAGIIVVVTTMAAFRNDPLPLSLGGERYRFIPMVAVIWSLILAQRYRPWICRPILVVIALNLIWNREHYRGPKLKNYRWATACACIGVNYPCKIKTPPQKWAVTFLESEPVRFGFHHPPPPP